MPEPAGSCSPRHRDCREGDRWDSQAREVDRAGPHPRLQGVSEVRLRDLPCLWLCGRPEGSSGDGDLSVGAVARLSFGYHACP